jgi:hypothetical protein
MMGYACPIMSRDMLIICIIKVFLKEMALPHTGRIDDTRDESVRIFSFCEKVSCG